MLIALEGCDATGKTTLARLLAKALGGVVVHCTTETPNTFHYFEELLFAAKHQTIIADRFCYGQFVYQEEKDRPLATFRPNTIDTAKDSWENLNQLEIDMLRTNTRVIYTWAEERDICNRMIARGENPKNVRNILTAYSDLWERTLIKPIYFKT